jgi:phage gpG-like protein
LTVQLSISTAGGDEIARGLAVLKSSAEDLTPVWPKILKRIRQQLRYHFAGEGASGRSGKWADLTDKYGTWKAKHFPGRPILELTGRLRESLVDGSADSIEILNTRFLFVGSSVPYAGFLQEGTSRMVRRPPISPTDRDVAEWIAEIHRYFDAEISKGYALNGRSVSYRRALVGA